jgi:hypothetical protein
MNFLMRLGNPSFFVPWEDVSVSSSSTFLMPTIEFHFVKRPEVTFELYRRPGMEIIRQGRQFRPDLFAWLDSQPMPPRLSRAKIVLVWLAVNIATMCVLGSINWWRFYRLASRGRPVEAIVNQTEPQNHQTVHYTYRIGSDTYVGKGHAGYGNPPFRDLRAGQSVHAFYLPDRPEDSCLGDPHGLLENETIPILLAAFTLSGLFAVSMWQRGRLDVS